jgi:hypothetical protein
MSLTDAEMSRLIGRRTAMAELEYALEDFRTAQGGRSIDARLSAGNNVAKMAGNLLAVLRGEADPT